MKIYTKTGDGFSTGLLGGRTMKNSPQIMAIGTLDELNASVGIVLSLEAFRKDAVVKKDYCDIRLKLERIQSELFHLGAWYSRIEIKEHYDAHDFSLSASVLEKEIDEWEKEIEPLKNFILPGGDCVAARLFWVRAVARRCELMFQASVMNTPYMITYLNRLSDWFFVLSRYCNKLSKTEETIWKAD